MLVDEPGFGTQQTKRYQTLLHNAEKINKLMVSSIEHSKQTENLLVHKISKKDELKKRTSHSIKVGACVLLHSQNTSTKDIKFRLRWRSDSFKMYQRNIIQLADKHKNAVASCVENKT